ncbi:MAG: ribonuclease HIII [Candidatus Micrarchaeia archaeon]
MDLRAEIEKISYMLPPEYLISNIKSIDYGIQFDVYKGEEYEGKIRIYYGKQGIKIDLSLLNQKTRKLIEGDASNQEAPGINTIGTDEAGKGDYFGPLVIAGAYVGASNAANLISMGVKDSKLVPDHKILKLADIIKDECTYSIISIGPEKYNALYEKFKNLNKLLAWGHARAIENLLYKVDCNIAIADQFGDAHFITEALMEKGKKIKLIQMPRAEKNISVAAASILARAEFVTAIEDLGNAISIPLPKGSSSPAVIETAKKVKDKFGMEGLSKVAKLHFKITSEI